MTMSDFSKVIKCILTCAITESVLFTLDLGFTAGLGLVI